MPLVVPILRFFVIFLNVYETFKTLKPPPPSARRGGQPSVRALTQRKRDLKGCLAIWVVWCCYAAYERTFDRIVGIFLPFYGEIKSVFLLFLLLTRAKGAEPLFLHVLRPLVKPYAAVVDPVLELSRDVGDFFFALLQVPLDYIQSSPWFPSWCTGKSEEPDYSSSSCTSTADARCSTRANDCSDTGHATPVLNRPSGAIRSVSDDQHGNTLNNPSDPRASRDQSSSTTPLSARGEQRSTDPPRHTRTLARHNGHQIWHPPTSVYPASNYDGSISTRDLLGTAPEYHSPEWRTYPAFPSAYPPTPLPPSASLPSSLITRSGRVVSDSAYPPISEVEQDFGEALERVHEGYPGSVHNSSNNNKIPPGVSGYEEYSNATRQPDDDTLLDDSMCSSEAGLSEDDFSVSLRTPLRSAGAMPSSACSSVDDLNCALTTTSSLRTKTSSDSLSSRSSSLAGRKRTRGALQGNARNTLPTSHPRNATLRGKLAPSPISQHPPQSSTSGDEDESEVGGDDGSTHAKRPRVLDPLKRISTVRPVARGLGNPRKGVLSSRNATVRNDTVPRGTTRTKAGFVAMTNSTIRGKKHTSTSHHGTRNGPQGLVKSSSTSSSQSGTLKRKGIVVE